MIKIAVFSRGLAISTIASLVWATFYTSILTVPLVLWVAVCACSFAWPRRRFKFPVYPSMVLLAYLVFLFILDYVFICLARFPDLISIQIVLASLRYAGSPFDENFYSSFGHFAARLCMLLAVCWVCKASFLHSGQSKIDLYLSHPSDPLEAREETYEHANLNVSNQEMKGETGDGNNERIESKSINEEDEEAQHESYEQLARNILFLCKKWAYMPILVSI